MMNMLTMDNRNRKLMIFCLGLVLIIVQIDFNTATSASQLNPMKYPLDDLYANLLQREYTGPLSLPNHFIVERKAQRSPSLRLRYGRSDPTLLYGNSEKRWFGDVNQKPIRSPSLRLRFGKRSENVEDGTTTTDYNSMLQLPIENRYDEQQKSHQQQSDENFGRIRWGKLGAPMEEDEEFNNYEDEYQSSIPTGFHLTHGLTTPALQMLLNYFSHVNPGTDDDFTVNYAPEFNREIRKPRTPLRLRWGRSIPNLPPAPPQETSSSSPADLDNKNLFTTIGNYKNNHNNHKINNNKNMKLLSNPSKPEITTHNG